jgi:hypothetical protein
MNNNQALTVRKHGASLGETFDASRIFCFFLFHDKKKKKQ